MRSLSLSLSPSISLPPSLPPSLVCGCCVCVCVCVCTATQRSVCACACVCVCARAYAAGVRSRSDERTPMLACLWIFVYACVCACVRARECYWRSNHVHESAEVDLALDHSIIVVVGVPPHRQFVPDVILVPVGQPPHPPAVKTKYQMTKTIQVGARALTHSCCLHPLLSLVCVPLCPSCPALSLFLHSLSRPPTPNDRPTHAHAYAQTQTHQSLRRSPK